MDKNNDFGFSAVSDIPTQPAKVAEPDSIQIIIDKLDQLLEQKELEDDDRVVRTQQEVTDKLQQLYNVVIPLYRNLLDSGDKDYIHWPNRKPKIMEEINKIESIMNG